MKKNNLNNIIFIYFNELGEKINLKNKPYEQSNILKNINSFIDNDFFTYQYSSIIYSKNENLPQLFIMELKDSEYILIKNQVGILSNLTNNVIVTKELLESKNLFFFRGIPKDLAEDSMFNSLVKLTPKSALFSLPLILFALLLPLYSNLFNSRLVYSESISSLLYISFIFVFIIGIEFFIKHFIHEQNLQEIKINIGIFNRYFLDLLQRSNCKSASIKVRTAESSILQVWELKPQIVYDIGLTILFSLCIISMLGFYSILLFLYYAALAFICVQVRFRSYQNMLRTNSINYEKSALYYSLEQKKQELRFLDENNFHQYVDTKNHEDENVKLKLNDANHHWAEIIRTNSFLSMMVMYITCYLAVGNGMLSLASIIAVLIINGRLSAAITGAINRSFVVKTHLFHIRSSINQLINNLTPRFKENGLKISKSHIFQTTNLTLNIDEKKRVDNLNMTVKAGEFIGITGISGSGKTSLINVLCGISQNYSGDISINNIKLNEISRPYFQQKIAYYSGVAAYFNGSLRDNFNLNGIFDDATMARLIMLCCPQLKISQETLEDILIADLPISTGEKQKLMLVSSLFKQPEIIFLDEATAFMASKDALNFMHLIRKELKLEDSIVFCATHDLGLSSLFTQHISLTTQASQAHRISVPSSKMNDVILPKISLNKTVL
ncbi:ATP-binding cassette domain-containing protein [Providencia alcalifaciens]|uniref:ATP-binding cassette domain-containing protein n=1 Tax=Providencia alcalifaciens TaxID=126385 RepID=UPI00029C5B25|nr:ATP-binding cassette domain-containing protein [Providencia alcalifaciens]EKT62865.1 type I secretion protein [Providencia alcalifaciens Dmel2]